MIDLRIYRAAFAPALVAVVVLMFSVEGVPQPVRAPENFAADFDGRRATGNARRIVETAPERTPGSTGDARVAKMVAERFGAIEAGTVSEQAYEARFDGEDVELRNVVLTLPGSSSRTIVVIAGRDSARGPGAASSAAATGVLLEMAAELGRTRHLKTIVLVSAAGSADGASGAREFLATYPATEEIDAAIVVAQPGASEPTSPHVVPWAIGPQSSSAQLVESATLALSEETGRRDDRSSFLGHLFRLAIPAGLGAEAVAISLGVDAIAISGAGERPLDPASDQIGSVSEDSIAEFGNTALALVLALDSTRELVHGPSEHLTLSDNLIGGWTLGLLALTLILPALVTAVDGVARSSRRGEPVLASLTWALSRALPFLGALFLAYLLALVGLAPDPPFPFDPGRFGLGWRSGVVMLATVAALVGGARLLRALQLPAGPRRETLATALGLVVGLVVLGIWLRNPYLGLLCVPLAHVWLIGARPSGAGIATTAIVLLVAAVPLAAAVVHLAARLDLGAALPWDLLLMVTGGQIGLVGAVLGCMLAGCLVGVAAVARRPQRDRSTVESPGR